MKPVLPRLTVFLIVSIVLMALAQYFRASDTLLSISLYKAHLMSLGGWGGYWLDRALYPYARPHLFCDSREACQTEFSEKTERIGAFTFHDASLRRAIIVAAALICVGLAA